MHSGISDHKVNYIPYTNKEMHSCKMVSKPRVMCVGVGDGSNFTKNEFNVDIFHQPEGIALDRPYIICCQKLSLQFEFLIAKHQLLCSLLLSEYKETCRMWMVGNCPLS